MSPAVALDRGPLRRAADTRGSAATAAHLAIGVAVDRACRKVAPLWPVKHFVAVNPFLGFADRTFAATCAAMRRVARVDMLMPRAFYREAVASGVVRDEDLAAALAEAPVPPRRPRTSPR